MSHVKIIRKRDYKTLFLAGIEILASIYMIVFGVKITEILPKTDDIYTILLTFFAVFWFMGLYGYYFVHGYKTIYNELIESNDYI